MEVTTSKRKQKNINTQGKYNMKPC